MKKFVAGIIARSYSRRSAGALLLVGVLSGATVGGFAVVRATGGSSSASSYVPVTPVRVLDTRSDLGLAVVTDGAAGTLKVTGSIPTATSSGGVVNAVVVPAGATAVVLNVTAVNPTSSGYVSLRPGDATGLPTVSTLNVTAGGTFPNGATITIPTTGAHAGQIQVWYEAESTTVGSTELLIDIAGYYELASTGSGAPEFAYKIGDTGPGGGLIFFVDYNDEYATYDYLEAAPTDGVFASSATSGVWATTVEKCGATAPQATNCQTDTIYTETGVALATIMGLHRGLFGGKAATAAIVARHDAGGVAKNLYAAGVADDYVANGITDWWLPSRNELAKMQENLNEKGVGGFSSDDYWSSSEAAVGVAWFQYFTDGIQGGYLKGYSLYVRPVRAF